MSNIPTAPTYECPSVPADAAMWGISNASKTGKVIGLWVGRSREESKASCKGCALLAPPAGEPRCYAHGGTPAMGHSSMIRAAKRGTMYTLKRAIALAPRSVKMARFGVIGDPAALPDAYLAKAERIIRRHGMDVVGYTHHWRAAGKRLAGRLMASCDRLEEVDEAIAAGYRAAVVLPHDHASRRFTTPAGHKGIVCPAIMSDRVTCNTCRLCDWSKSGPVIGFPDHGPTAPRASKAKRQPVKAPNFDDIDI